MGFNIKTRFWKLCFHKLFKCEDNHTEKNIQNTVVIIFIENGKGKKQYKIRIEILHRKFQMAKVQS